MGLDILTPKGAETRSHEDEAVALWHSRFPACRYVHTLKDEPAAADAILVSGGLIYAVAEMKCRQNLSLHKFQQEFRSEWLVTHQKIVDCVTVCELLRVQFIGMLYLVDEKALFYKAIWTPCNGYEASFSVRRSVTQATVNGGTAERANAYIDMRDAKVIQASEMAA